MHKLRVSGQLSISDNPPLSSAAIVREAHGAIGQLHLQVGSISSCGAEKRERSARSQFLRPALKRLAKRSATARLAPWPLACPLLYAGEDLSSTEFLICLKHKKISFSSSVEPARVRTDEANRAVDGVAQM
jgi:hypothetical protein